MKKLALFMCILMSLFLVVACSNSQSVMDNEGDLLGGKTPLDFYKESNTKSLQIENMNMDMTMSMNMNIPDENGQSTEMLTNMNMVYTVINEPMKMKVDMNLTNSFGEEQMQQNMSMYVVEEDETMYMYQLIDGQWYKMVYMDNETYNEIYKSFYTNPNEQLALMENSIENVEIIGEEKINDRKTVKLKLAINGTAIEEFLNSFGQVDAFIPTELDKEVLNQMIEELGSLEYFVWVDTENMYTVRTYIDISEYLQKMMTILSEFFGTSEGEQSELLDMFNNISAKMTVNIKDINACEDFEIPEAALNGI